jgi:hypothetical protein
LATTDTPARALRVLTSFLLSRRQLSSEPVAMMSQRAMPLLLRLQTLPAGGGGRWCLRANAVRTLFGGSVWGRTYSLPLTL